MKKLILTIFTALFALVTYAQTDIKVEVHRVVEVGEQFNVTFIIEGENSVSDFSWTPSSDFQLLWGPQSGRSSNVQIVNGKMTKSVQSTYTYVLTSAQEVKDNLDQEENYLQTLPIAFLINRDDILEYEDKTKYISVCVADGYGNLPNKNNAELVNRLTKVTLSIYKALGDESTFHYTDVMRMIEGVNSEYILVVGYMHQYNSSEAATVYPVLIGSCDDAGALTGYDALRSIYLYETP